MLAEGDAYSLTVKLGDRVDLSYGSGVARLVSSNGTVIASQVLTEPANGNWSSITLASGPIAAALAGRTLRIEIQQNAANGANQLLVDDVALTQVAGVPGGNPAAAEVATNGGPDSVFEGLTVDSLETAFVANAGVLGGGRYNQWFVSFGQFF